MNFEELKIVDLDLDLTQPSDKAPGLRHMYLKLSDAPPYEWSQIFEQERSFPRHSMWRHAWISGSHIVVDCVPEELEQYHLKDLKTDVSNTNQKYQEYIKNVEAEETKIAQAVNEEAQRLQNLKSKLDFDD